jgi:hypothetical protein
MTKSNVCNGHVGLNRHKLMRMHEVEVVNKGQSPPSIS